MRVIDQQFGQQWALYHGDSAEVLRGLATGCVDLACYSPPFSSLFVYSASERDVGNARTDAEFFAHYAFVTRELLRVTKPGRLVCVHATDLGLTKNTHGVIGLKDFTGALIAHHVGQGFVYHGRVTIDRCPQGVACRRKATSLMFQTLERDRTAVSPVFCDYLLLFRAPGENAVPIKDDSVSREDWIKWARGVYDYRDRLEQTGTLAWYDIEETETLNVRAARENADERHMCPLSLDTVERVVRLWSNKGETVLDPFSGIGSVGYQSVLLGRRYVGVELKGSYFNSSVRNLVEAERLAREPSLFDDLEPAGSAP